MEAYHVFLLVVFDSVARTHLCSQAVQNQVVALYGHDFILCGTQSTKNTPTWYKTYAIVGVVSIPTYKQRYAGNF
jgi:hypothetical protein